MDDNQEQEVSLTLSPPRKHGQSLAAQREVACCGF